MIRVFLVEDEIVMRQGIKNNIPWEAEGFDFVGEASDGELAYPLIKKTKPDILITDIRMPFMDGLELSSMVKKELPFIKIIILSGYNEFAYAKQAIGIGITDYLLKPISSAKLLEAVKNTAEIIEKEREHQKMIERYQEEIQDNSTQEKRKLFIDLVTNQCAMGELLERGNQLDLDLSASLYLVLLFQVMPYGKAYEYSKQLAWLEEQMYASALQEEIIIFERGSEGWAFLIKGEEEGEVNERTKQWEITLKRLIHSCQNVEYFGGEGKVVYRLRDVRNSYQEASRAFASRFFTDLNQIVSYDKVNAIVTGQTEEIHIEGIHSKNLERKLVEEFLKNATQEEVSHFIEEYFMNVGEGNYKSLIFRQYMVIDIFFCVTEFLQHLGIQVENLPEKQVDINEIMAKITSVETIKYQLKQLLESTLELRDTQSTKRNCILLDNAKIYIQEHYADDAISLHAVAMSANISPSYFSTIFSQEVGQTFIEYLTAIRLEKAKELLMCSSMKTSEVGYAVGYKDSHYFSYIFKKTQHCTPREYRMRGKE